jgi:predicted RNA-binding protein
MAVGVASMSAAEMMEKRKGEAVHVRHLRKEEAGG